VIVSPNGSHDRRPSWEGGSGISTDRVQICLCARSQTHTSKNSRVLIGKGMRVSERVRVTLPYSAVLSSPVLNTSDKLSTTCASSATCSGEQHSGVQAHRRVVLATEHIEEGISIACHFLRERDDSAPSCVEK
jgi:hypothetical protein